jgi:23S rRNA (guanosine2251-2'-O)-methyltransferase
MSKIIGRNPVLEALRGGRDFEKLIAQKNATGSIQKILDTARERRVPIQFAEKSALDRIADSGAHQGIVAFVAEYRYAALSDILQRAADRSEPPFVVLLDGLEDPRNLGAILRTAEGAGVHGVVIPKRRAVGLTEAAVKTSAGAAEYIPVAQATNLTRSLIALKDAGLWTVALDLNGTRYFEQDLVPGGGVALVIGGEGGGVSRLVRENCDFAVSIPMSGKLASLNASAAAAIVIYEIRRQRIREGGE